MPFKLSSQNYSVATRARQARFAAALFLTLTVGLTADAYKQAQLRRNIAPPVSDFPSVLLPKPGTASAVRQSRVIWVDDSTLLHLQQVQSMRGKADATPQISLVRYRYATVGGQATLHKEQEYLWPFDETLTFAWEPASEVRLSADRQNLLVPLCLSTQNAWRGPHFVGLIALNPKRGSPRSGLWKIKIPPEKRMPYQIFWLPDNRHFVVVLEGEAIDIFDINQNTPGVRIAADPVSARVDSNKTTKIALRDKEVLGVNPVSELVLRQRPDFISANQQKIQSIVLEMVPLSAQGVRPGRQQKYHVSTTALDMQDALLAPDGKRLMFRGFFPAPRYDRRWQSLVRPGFTSQFATLDLQNGIVTPLFAENIKVQLYPNASWSFPASISWRNKTSSVNFTPQWLPGSLFVGVSPDDKQAANNYAVWRISITGR